MEQGPVLVISFTSQEISVVHDATGRVVEGDAVSLPYQFAYSSSCLNFVEINISEFFWTTSANLFHLLTSCHIASCFNNNNNSNKADLYTAPKSRSH